MVTGELPFKSNGPLDAWMKKIHNELTAPRKLNPELSERTDWAIRRAMSADPNNRPTSCREFVEDLTGHSTRKITPAESSGSSLTDMWYLVYKDEEGATHTVKGTTAAIRRSLKEGLLGDASNVRASKVKTGPFELVRGYPEFRDLVMEPAKGPNELADTLPQNTPVPNNPLASPARRGANPARAAPAIPMDGNPNVHIPMSDPPQEPTTSALMEGIKWTVGLILIAAATAFVAFHWFPK
jgi:hypothetical protein